MEEAAHWKWLILLTFYVLKVIIKETSLLTILFYLYIRSFAMLSPKELSEVLKAQGMKITPQRLEVYRPLPAPKTIPRLQKSMKKCGSRCLPEFCHYLPVSGIFLPDAPDPDCGCSDGTMRYDVDPHPHPHFRCEKCGKVFNLDFAYHKHLDQDVAKKPVSPSAATRPISWGSAGSVRNRDCCARHSSPVNCQLPKERTRLS